MHSDTCRTRPCNATWLVLAIGLGSTICSFAAGQMCGDWLRVASDGPAARSEHALAFHEARGVTVLFGGWDNPNDFSDTWTWDGVLWQFVTNEGPAPRHGHAMTYDRRRQVVVLFGGQNGIQRLGDTWEWDGERWMHITDVGPSPRGRNAMAYDSHRGVTVLFGGDTGSEQQETWEWDGDSWTMIADTGPLPRSWHSMVFDESQGKTVLFGGRRSVGLNDTWEWDGLTWNQVSITGPAPRWGHSMVYDDAWNIVLLYGGADSGRFADTWAWNEGAWLRLDVTLPPGPRSLHAMAFDSRRKATVLFGGSDGITHRNDTWERRTPWWFEAHPTDLTVGQGSPAAFQVRVAGPSNVRFQWRRDGEELVNGGTIYGVDTDTLVISNARRSDSGQYDCLVRGDGCDATSREASLTVVAPTLEVDADCPGGGSVVCSWQHAWPDGEVALLFSAATGHMRIPDGQPCAGTRLGLAPHQLQVVSRTQTGPDGSGSIELQAPSRACGGYLQLIDLTSCGTSSTQRLE